MAERRVRFGIKVALMTGTYEGIRDAWLEAERLDVGQRPPLIKSDKQVPVRAVGSSALSVKPVGAILLRGDVSLPSGAASPSTPPVEPLDHLRVARIRYLRHFMELRGEPLHGKSGRAALSGQLQ